MYSEPGRYRREANQAEAVAATDTGGESMSFLTQLFARFSSKPVQSAPAATAAQASSDPAPAPVQGPVEHPATETGTGTAD